MKRIGYLDSLRGYALICIMLDHMPVGTVRQLTLVNFAIFDAAELFVLLSGFLVGLVWVKIEAREGLSAAQWRFAKRSFQVWRALIIGGIMIALLSRFLWSFGMEHTAVWYEYSNWIVAHPFGYIVTLAVLWMQPNLLDVLALYVILLASAPIFVPLLIRSPALFAAGSVMLWWFAPPLNALIPNQRPDPGFLFNPFGWQMLFYAGVGIGVFRRQIYAALAPWAKWITIFATFIVIYSLLMATLWKFGGVSKDICDAMWRMVGTVNKWRMDGFRFLAIMCATWLVAVPLSRPINWLANTRLGRGAADIGRGGLFSFILCVMLSIIGDAMVVNTPDASKWTKISLETWTVLVLWLGSYMWLHRQVFLDWVATRRSKGQG